MPEEEQAWDLGVLRIKGLGWLVASGYRGSQEIGINKVGVLQLEKGVVINPQNKSAGFLRNEDQ